MANIRTDFEQGSDEWYAARCGKFTGSDYHIFLGNSETKKNELLRIAGERLTQDTEQEYKSSAMERGSLLEAEARRIIASVIDTPIIQVGLIEEDKEFHGWVTCSPDGLINDDTILEIKCPLFKGFLGNIMKFKETGLHYVEPTYRTQVQFNLMVSERQSCVFMRYHPRFTPEVFVIERDEDYISLIKESLRENIKKVEDIVNAIDTMCD